MNKWLLPLALCAPMTAFWVDTASACSADTPCEVTNGEYYFATPDMQEDTKPPAVIYLHGAGGSGAGVFRNAGLVKRFTDRGYVFVAPSGVQRGNGRGGTWSFHPDRTQLRDEVAFLTDVRDDLINTQNVDPDHIILVGFSIGGSMTAYLACAAPDTFDAYSPLAGNFWRPHPEQCEAPVQMLHTHGWTDGTVPLEGRVLRGGDINNPDALKQGDVFHAMSIWRETNECTRLQPNRFPTQGPFMRRRWDDCAPGSALEFALFDGGHRVPNGWSDLVLDWYESLEP
jgi:polyhydroxybutyrate depolymerase